MVAMFLSVTPRTDISAAVASSISHILVEPFSENPFSKSLGRPVWWAHERPLSVEIAQF